MTYKRLIVLVLFLCSLGCAAESLPLASAAVRQACPNAPALLQIEFARGDLNGDKIPDAAILLGCKSAEDQELIVLHGQKSGSYQIARRSQVWLWNSRSEVELEIRNGVLIFSEHCAYNCNPESWSSTFRFATHHGQFVLAGEDHSRSIRSGSDFKVENEYGQSFNYLTGKAIAWEKGEAGYSRKEIPIKFVALLKFVDFNFESCQSRQVCVQRVESGAGQRPTRRSSGPQTAGND